MKCNGVSKQNAKRRKQTIIIVILSVIHVCVNSEKRVDNEIVAYIRGLEILFPTLWAIASFILQK